MSEKQIGMGWATDTSLIPPVVVSQAVHVSNTLHSHQEVSRPTSIQVSRPVTGFRLNGSEIPQSAISSLLSSTTHSIVTSLPITSARKRKLSPEEILSLKKKLTESDAVRLKKIQSTYAERCAILCFLQNNGLPADYTVWRSHLPFASLASYLRINRLKADDETEDLYSVLKSSSLISASHVRASTDGSRLTSPHGSPINNQGIDRRLGKPVKSTLATQGLLSPIKHQDGLPASNQEQIVERAKQEAYVMQRISELQRDGMWSEKRLPKVYELPRPKSHWDYVLEEMTWLAADFAQERKWKKAAARKCAYLVKKHLQQKEINSQKADEDKEKHLRQIAGTIAKGVTEFWANIEKIVELKEQVMMKAKKKNALDQQLNLLIDSSIVAQKVNNQTSLLKDTSGDHNVECIINN